MTTEQRREVQAAFNQAFKTGHLSLENADQFMYMRSNENTLFFKNIDTREYLLAPRIQ